MTTFHTIGDLSRNAFNRDNSAIKTGIKELDRFRVEVAPGNLLLVGSRPTIGRTSFLLFLFHKIGEAAQTAQCFITNEDTEEHVFLKLAATVTGIERQKLATQADGAPGKAPAILSGDRDFLLERRVAWQDLKKDMDWLVREKQIRMFYIDKVQGLFSAERFSNRDQELGFIIRELKNFALDNRVTIFLSSTLSRAVERREGKSPYLSDLRDSGALEEFCDAIMLIHRPEVYGITSDEDGNNLYKYAELHLCKNRYGPTGHMKFSFNAKIPRFEEFFRYYDYDYENQFNILTDIDKYNKNLPPF